MIGTLIVDGTMRPLVIVTSTPTHHLLAGMRKCQELMLDQTNGSEAIAKCFNECIIRSALPGREKSKVIPWHRQNVEIT
jgi:hypothetical protein